MVFSAEKMRPGTPRSRLGVPGHNLGVLLGRKMVPGRVLGVPERRKSMPRSRLGVPRRIFSRLFL